jgi:hypothetical protein
MVRFSTQLLFPREGAPGTHRAEGWIDPRPTTKFGEEKIKPRVLGYQHAPYSLYLLRIIATIYRN